MITTTEARPVEVVTAAVEAKVAEYSQPDRTHRYVRGIHADVANCGACGRLHAYRHVLALLRELGL